ncbi:hypothetical protein D3C75_705850 [compost metagenome]
MAVTLSTGIINKTISTIFAHLEILNLNSGSRTVRVQVIDWDNRASLFNSLVPVADSNTVTVSVQDVPFHYEIRVTVPSSRNLIINTFAIDNATFTVDNNNVLQRQLVRVFPPFPSITKKVKAKFFIGRRIKFKKKK